MLLVLNVPFTWYLLDVLHDNAKKMEKYRQAVPQTQKEVKIKTIKDEH